MDAVLQEFSYLETLVSYLFCVSLILLLIVPFLVERLMKTPKKAAPVLIFGFLAVLCIFFQFNLLSDWESRHQVAVLEQMGSSRGVSASTSRKPKMAHRSFSSLGTTMRFRGILPFPIGWQASFRHTAHLELMSMPSIRMGKGMYITESHSKRCLL